MTSNAQAQTTPYQGGALLGLPRMESRPGAASPSPEPRSRRGQSTTRTEDANAATWLRSTCSGCPMRECVIRGSDGANGGLRKPCTRKEAAPCPRPAPSVGKLDRLRGESRVRRIEVPTAREQRLHASGGFRPQPGRNCHACTGRNPARAPATPPHAIMKGDERADSDQGNGSRPILEGRWQMNDATIWREAYNAALTGLQAWSPSDPDQKSLDGDPAADMAVYSADRALVDYRKRFPAQANDDAPWTGHARVELMGHRSYLGRIREVERYGARLGEVQELLPSGEYGDLHTFGGKGVYEIHPMTLDAALKELRPAKAVYCQHCGNRVRIVEWGDANYEKAADETCNRCSGEGGEKVSGATAFVDSVLHPTRCNGCLHRDKDWDQDPCIECKHGSDEGDEDRFEPANPTHPEQDEAAQ